MSDYTPTTANVRDQFAAYEDPRKKQFYDYPTEAEAFNRWLTAHDDALIAHTVAACQEQINRMIKESREA